jgi:valyl-tRNA synthetase
MAAPGTDIAFSETRTDSYRAFANKIWNAARFIFMNVDRAEQDGLYSLAEFKKTSRNGHGLQGFKAVNLDDRWIASRFNRVTKEIHDALADFRFHEAAHVVYHFFWGEFCDWYIELIKPRLNAESAETQKLALFTVMGVLEGSLRLLHPIMPFITEEIFEAVYEGKPPKKSIALVEFPTFDKKYLDPEAEREMELLQELIVAVRTIRAELKVEPKQSVPIKLYSANGARSSIERNRVMLEKLANVSEVSFAPQSLSNHPGSRATAQFEVAVIYERKVDVGAERERLQKELAKMEGELAGKEKQLANQAFTGKAPADVVEGMRKRAAELEILIQKNRQALKELQ